MKVLFLSDDFPPQSFGGAGISTFELAKGVKTAGHEVFVVTTVRSKSEARVSEHEGLKIYKIASDYAERWRAFVSLYNYPVLKELKSILEEVRPDVVHANNIHNYLSYHSIKLAKKYAKVVVTLRDAMSFSFGKLATEKYLENFDAHLSWLDQFKQAKKRWNPFRNFLIKKYLRDADKIFAVSQALKKALEENDIKGVEVLHTGIDEREYKAPSKKLRRKTIFFAGRLSEAKGAKVAEKVWQSVLRALPDAELLMAGTNRKWLNREEMRAAYARSDVVLVPSVCFDAFPRTVLEAMAASRPVVSTHYGGAPEAIVDGVTGYVVSPSDAEAMAEKILSLLRDPEKARRMGQAGRERIKKVFNIDDKVKRLIACYRELAG
jgi:glycosyltransferase involved in cell wall biosynthesis